MKNIQQRMLTNLDIYRSANILVKQHGQDAPIQAAMGADAMLEAGIALLLNDNVGGGKTG